MFLVLEYVQNFIKICKTLAGALTHACTPLPLYETLKVEPFVIHCELPKADSESGRASCSELSILALLLYYTSTRKSV